MSYLKADRKKRKRTNGNNAPAVIGIVLLIVLIGLGITIFVKCPSRRQCNAVIEKFQISCNEKSLTGMMNCLKPSLTNNLVKIGTTVVGDEAVDMLIKVLGSGMELIGTGSGEDVSTLFELMKLEPKQYGIPGRERKVRCKASFGAFVQYVDIYITKVYGDPYIEKVVFVE